MPIHDIDNDTFFTREGYTLTREMMERIGFELTETQTGGHDVCGDWFMIPIGFQMDTYWYKDGKQFVNLFREIDGEEYTGSGTLKILFDSEWQPLLAEEMGVK